MPRTKKAPATSQEQSVDSQEASCGNTEVQMDRRWRERRAEDSAEADAPSENEPANTDEDGEQSFNPPRRKKQRRRQIDPTTCERDYNNEEITFMRALDDYKRKSGRMFPTCSEILEVVRDLGYIKLSEEESQLLSSIQEVEDDLAEATAFDEAEALDESDDMTL